MSEWPGYTPPASGSSQNSGTPPLSSYTNRAAAVRAQYAADGADVSQEPPQYYGAHTSQKRNEPEAHTAPTAPGKPTVAASGTAGSATITWTASASRPSGGYLVEASSGQKKTVNGLLTTTTLSGLTVGASITVTVTAVGLQSTAVSAASNSYTVV
ncbi:hypothetical protein [Streptomyces sp. NPDC017448]|uniref:hypothetical protein n=1 Tax=Streptomyces sp. NPDC017448 TaxID=3364996 RepID=UPI0037A1C8A9